MTGQRRRRRSRSSGAVAAAPPLLLLLLFLLATCLLRDIAPLASAQPEGYEGDDDNDAPSFDEDDEGARSSPLPPKPSIDDVAPNALVSTLRGSPRWKLPDLLVRRTAVIECEGGQVILVNKREREEREVESAEERRRISSPRRLQRQKK